MSHAAFSTEFRSSDLPGRRFLLNGTSLKDAGGNGQSGGAAGKADGAAGVGGLGGSGGDGSGGVGTGGRPIDSAVLDTTNDMAPTADSGTEAGEVGPGNWPPKGRTGMKSAGCGKPPMGAVATTFTNHRIAIPTPERWPPHLGRRVGGILVAPSGVVHEGLLGSLEF
jgi:hypothetical protein